MESIPGRAELCPALSHRTVLSPMNMQIAFWDSCVMFIPSMSLHSSFWHDLFPLSHRENACLSQPVYIVEIGAGHGKLGYLILNHLLTFRESFPKSIWWIVLSDLLHRRDKTICLCHYWFYSRHYRFAQRESFIFKVCWWRNLRFRFIWYFSLSCLVYQVLDCEKQQEIELLNSGVKLNSETMKNPSIFISNYVFNGLKQDLYSYKDGELQEGYVTVFTDKEYITTCLLLILSREENKEDPSIISRMRFKWFFQKRESTDPLYEDEQFNKIIQTYKICVFLRWLCIVIRSVITTLRCSSLMVLCSLWRTWRRWPIIVICCCVPTRLTVMRMTPRCSRAFLTLPFMVVLVSWWTSTPWESIH